MYRMPNARFAQTHDLIESVLEDGYYALRVGDTGKIKFYRVTHPKKGKLTGAFKVQSQHSDQLRPELVHRNYAAQPYQAITVEVYRPGVEQDLLDIVTSKQECQLLYAQEKVHCFRCGKKLTDERSRWYGFGPECEKELQGMKELVEDMKNSSYENRKIEINF